MLTRRQLVAGSVSVAAAGAAAVSLLGGRGVRRFPYQAAPLSEEAYRALATRPGWNGFLHRPEAGVTLRGLSRPPKRKDAPWVLFWPGNASAQLDEAQKFLEQLSGDRDVGLWVLAYRGFDGSSGTPEVEAILRDARSALRAHEAPGSRHLVGFSLGTAVVAALASQEKVASLSLVAPMTEIDVGATGLRGRLLGGDRYETLRWFGGNTRTLVIGAERDEPFGVEMAREVSRRARAKYVEVPTNHVGLLTDERALEAIRSFAQL